jgi:hypothetical protein
MLWAALALGVQTPYLRIDDNLEEPENVGFCIDLKGWNPVRFEDAQAHSCKPTDGRAGGGTDEEFEPRGGAIAGRADAAGRCLQAKSVTAGSGVDVPLCNGTEPLQHFSWRATTGMLSLEATTLCLGVGASLRAANSFWARDLVLAECGTTDAKYITWRIEGGSATTFDCTTKEVWTAEKSTWCCDSDAIGCPSAVSTVASQSPSPPPDSAATSTVASQSPSPPPDSAATSSARAASWALGVAAGTAALLSLVQ